MHEYPNWNESSKTVQYEPIGELGFPIHRTEGRLEARVAGQEESNILDGTDEFLRVVIKPFSNFA
jgi:hypothetical protein